MDILKIIEKKVRQTPRNLVLAEGEEPRTVEAAGRLLAQKLVGNLILLGDPAEINKQAAQCGVDVSGAELIDPLQAPDFEEYAQEYFNLRKGKLSQEECLEGMKNVLAYGSMLVRKERADGMVAGAVNTTADVLRNAIRIIGPKPGVNTVSSCFLMVCPDPSFGEEGLLGFADCAVIPDPTPEQLADIACSTAESFRSLSGHEPRVGFLSFSTKGSARHPAVQKVEQAVEILKKRDPGFRFDGTLQFDAAVLPKVGAKKAPDSKVAGKVNVCIFPDLNSGNIGYKIAERIGGARAVGPIIQGLSKPVNDLSRGCSVDDIFNVSLITQSQA